MYTHHHSSKIKIYSFANSKLKVPKIISSFSLPNTLCFKVLLQLVTHLYGIRRVDTKYEGINRFLMQTSRNQADHASTVRDYNVLKKVICFGLSGCLPVIMLKHIIHQASLCGTVTTIYDDSYRLSNINELLSQIIRVQSPYRLFFFYL